jgi:hypothetical protein
MALFDLSVIPKGLASGLQQLGSPQAQQVAGTFATLQAQKRREQDILAERERTRREAALLREQENTRRRRTSERKTLANLFANETDPIAIRSIGERLNTLNQEDYGAEFPLLDVERLAGDAEMMKQYQKSNATLSRLRASGLAPDDPSILAVKDHIRTNFFTVPGAIEGLEKREAGEALIAGRAALAATPEEQAAIQAGVPPSEVKALRAPTAKPAGVKTTTINTFDEAGKPVTQLVNSETGEVIESFKREAKPGKAELEKFTQLETGEVDEEGNRVKAPFKVLRDKQGNIKGFERIEIKEEEFVPGEPKPKSEALLRPPQEEPPAAQVRALEDGRVAGMQEAVSVSKEQFVKRAKQANQAGLKAGEFTVKDIELFYDAITNPGTPTEGQFIARFKLDKEFTQKTIAQWKDIFNKGKIPVKRDAALARKIFNDLRSIGQ